MKVSVIIPAFQSELYINSCLDSILNQTLKDFEIIVVNDGSTDNTGRILEQYAISNPNIIIINQHNSGIIESKKRGLVNANGEYILFVDSDDEILPNTLEILYCEATEFSADIVIYNALLYIENRIEPCLGFKSEFCQQIEEDPLKMYLLEKIHSPMWCKFIKRSYLLENNVKFPSNISYCEDTSTSASLFMFHPKVKCCESFLYHYIDRRTSNTHSHPNSIHDFKTALLFVTEELIEKGLFENYVNELDCFAHHILNWGNYMLEYSPELQSELDLFYKQWKQIYSR